MVHRAEDTRTGRAVILKRVRPDAADHEDLRRLRNERDVLAAIEDPNVARLLDSGETGREVWLVLEDIGGEAAARRCAREPLSLAEALRVGITVARALAAVHARDVVHRDVSPNNVAIAPDGRVQLFDFDLSTRLPRSLWGGAAPDHAEGTLAYAAPEQAGRTSRPIDERSDLYALGATLYELVCGRPPFLSDDPLELYHAHLARRPDPPHEVRRGVPAQVSAILLKLLEKAPEDRYRSALGAALDLEACLEGLERDGVVPELPLATRDVPARLHLSGRLHGRGRELREISAAFDAPGRATPPVILIAGPSGIGKSSLMRALERTLFKRGGFPGVYKLAKGRSEVPYEALAGAIYDLLELVFAASDEEIAAIRARASRICGAAGAPLVDLIPQLAVLLGTPPRGRAGAVAPSRARVRGLFIELFRALPSPDRPIALFIDDAQWADASSLELLGALARDRSASGLRIVATCREEGLEPGHPLAALVGGLRADGLDPCVVAPGPLDVEALSDLLSEATALPAGEARPLASLLRRKTGGNAFSASVFLATIYRERLLSFDPSAGRWTWDAAGIEALPVTDNVAALLTDRALGLGADVRRVLGVAACLGGTFDARLVARVGGLSEGDAAAALAQAAREGVLVTVQGGLRFSHDRVLEAVYREVPPEEMRAHHLAACGSLRSLIEQPETDPLVFEVLRHAAGLESFPDLPVRLEVIRLGLVAGKRARFATDFEVAGSHFDTALARLPEDGWTIARELSYDLHFAAAECALSAGRTEEGERLFSVLLAHAGGDVARARAWAMRARCGFAMHRHAEALEQVRRGCALLGVRLPDRPSPPLIMLELARTMRLLKGRSMEELAAAPPLRDARVEAALEVLHAGITPAFTVDKKLLAILVLKGTALCAEHGNSPSAAAMYTHFGILLGGILRDDRRRDQFGRLGMELADKHPGPTACRAWLGNGILIQYYRDHLRTALPLLEKANRLGLLYGDTSAATLSADFLTMFPLLAGDPLVQVLAVCDAQFAMASSLQAIQPMMDIAFARQAVLALLGRTDAPGSLASYNFNPEIERRHLIEAKISFPLAFLRFWSAFALGHCERPREALAELDALDDEGASELQGQFILGERAFQRALALSALIKGGGLGRLEREKLTLKLRLSVRELAEWGERAPHNFSHKHALAAAELAAITGDGDAAIRGYEEAIAGAQRGEVLQDIAAAQERAGRFFFARGAVAAATPYLAAARRTYARWGAAPKVAMLDRRFPGLAAVSAATDVAIRESRPDTRSTATGSGSGSGLDTPSMLKAAQALSSERTIEGLLGRVMTIVAESAGAERASLFLLDGATDAPRVLLRAVLRAGSAPSVLAEPRPLEEIQAPAGVVRWVLRTGERVRLDDASAEGPFTQEPYMRSRRSRSVLVMPLLWQGDVLGALALENDLVAGAFTEQRAGLLTALCAQLATSIQNARSYAELERKVGERTAALRDAQSRIISLEKEATEAQMAGGFAHEMRNALAGARMLLRVALGAQGVPDGGAVAQASRHLRDLLLEAGPALPPERAAAVRRAARGVNDAHRQVDDLLRRVDDAVARGLDITNDVLAYSALRREERGETAVYVLPLVEAISRDLDAPELRIEIDVPEEAAILCKPEHARSILENLARNACEAIAEAAPPLGGLLRISASAGDSFVTIDVADNGTGMSPEIKARMFEPFFSTKPSSGMGLGLGIVRKLVALYEGSISVETVVGGGTTFTVSLPAAPPVEVTIA